MSSIRGRLMLGLLAGSGTLLAIGSFALSHEIAERAGRDFDDALLAQARALVSLISVDGDKVRFDFADEAFPQFDRDRHPYLFEVRRRDGSVVERSESLRRLLAAAPTSAELGPDSMPSHDGVVLDAPMPNGAAGRRVTLLASPLQRESDEEEGQPEQVEPAPAASTVAFITVARDRARLDGYIQRMRFAVLGLGGAMILATWGVVLWTLRWGLAPLDRVSYEVAGMDAASLGCRLREEALPDELLPVVRQLNGLLGRLEASFERERDFSANAAHELRTPLTELRTLCDVALAAPRGDEPLLRSLLVDARGAGLQMERITSNLLALAAAEGGRGAGAIEEVRLRPLIEQAWATLATAALSRGISLKLDAPPEAQAPTVRDRLELVLSNLLENAVQHAPVGAQISVRVVELDHGAEIAIANRAPDLEPADIPRLFDRFWRKSAAREATGHVGLGLPLAAAVAKTLNAPLEARLIDQALILRILLPGLPSR